MEARTREVVWNRSDNRVKLICLCTKASPTSADMPPSPTTGSIDFPSPETINGAAFESYADSVKSAPLRLAWSVLSGTECVIEIGMLSVSAFDTPPACCGMRTCHAVMLDIRN